MRLKQILQNEKGLNGSLIPYDLEIQDICMDSRKVGRKCLFVAMQGQISNGKEYIGEVIRKGVKAVVLDQNIKIQNKNKNVIYVPVKDPRMFLRNAVKKFYHTEGRKVKVIGITGTNGKTTISYLLEAMLKDAGKECGVIGTVNHRFAQKVRPAKNTTPGYLENQKMLCEMSDKNVAYCAMEVSSHALDQGRVDDISFKTAIFTNLTNEHLDYHRTLENYFLSKAQLFTQLAPKALAIINQDDAFGMRLKKMCHTKVLTYGIKNQADIMAKDIFLGLDGSSFTITTPQESIFVKTHLIGIFNVYNILAATAAAVKEKVPLQSIKKTLLRFRAVPGRLEKVRGKSKVPIFIDYAHTPDALLNVLKALRTVTSRKILLVFGCGGDRDHSKRPVMGKIASLYADFSIVTSDNPRQEDPKEIIKQIMTGFTCKRYLVIEKREKAIAKALKIAKPHHVILVAGKGHEDYQIFKDKRIDFNEKKIIQTLLNDQHSRNN